MEEFLKEIEKGAKRLNIKPATVLQKVGLSGLTWDHWKSGGTCTMRKADEVREWLKAALAAKEAEESARDANGGSQREDAA